jgi:tetratricopeptide (TPR) repeat protein
MSKHGGFSVVVDGYTLNRNKRAVRILWATGFLTVQLTFDEVRASVEALPIRTLSAAETAIYRGDLQLHNGRLPEALALLEGAMKENATLAPAHASAGLVLALQRRYSEAHAAFDKARLLDPENNALGYYYTAWAIREESRSKGEALSTLQLWDMEAALRDAVDIDASFVEAKQLLAETQMLLKLNPNASMRLLLDAMKRSPGRQSLVMLLARLSIAGGDKPTAGWLLQRVIASGATDSTMRKEARVLLTGLNLSLQEKIAYADFQINESPDAGRHIEIRMPAKGEKVPGTEELQFVRGRLENVVCNKGLTLHVRIGAPDIDERVENLHTDAPSSVEWATDTGETVDAIKCETPVVPTRVLISYRPKRKGLTMGEPVFVQFCRGGSFDCDVRNPPPPQD